MDRNVFVRETSEKAYIEIQQSGVLADMQWKVYDLLFKTKEGLTGTEVDALLKDPNDPNPSYHKRLSELARAGSVKRAGVRACTVTGHECDIWVVTESVPDPAKLKPLRRLPKLTKAKLDGVRDEVSCHVYRESGTLLSEMRIAYLVDLAFEKLIEISER